MALLNAAIFPCLLLSLVMEGQSQTHYPHISFMGKILPTHSYVDLNLVGDHDSGNDSVQCHTNLSTCCNMVSGIYNYAAVIT